MIKDYQRELNKPFEAHDIEWRVSRKGVKNNKPWAVAIPYITSRAVQDRLDSVFGLFGWKNELRMVTAKGFIAGVSVKHEGEWVTKWDGAEGSDSNGMDLIKSGASNAIKRAAVLLGIGRYLYELDEVFVECVISQGWQHPYNNVYQDKKNNNILVAWQTPTLPTFALPGFDIEAYINDMKASKNGDELEEAYKNAKRASLLHQNKNMLKAANDAGKAKREEFNVSAALTIEEDTKTIKLWLDKQIRSFALIPNEAAVDGVYRATVRDLKGKVKNSLVDIEPLQNELQQKFEIRIKQLQEANKCQK